MNTIKKTAQAAKTARTSTTVRIGRLIRSGLFRTVHITAWVAYFAWLLMPPMMWFSATPAHSHTATYWMGAIYLVAVGLMTWSGYISKKAFQRWESSGEAWAGWGGVAFSLPVIFAPALPFVLLAAIPSMGNGGVGNAREEDVWDPLVWDPMYSFYSGNAYHTDD